MSDRRARCEILMDLVRACDGGKKRTPMFRAANVNFRQGERYLERCLDAGLIDEGGEDGFYVVTEKGHEVLGHWAEVEASLAPVLASGGLERSE